MASVTVVGANGFIGSHLVDALAADGHEVTAFGRFRGPEPMFTAPDVRLLRGDFLNRSDLAAAVAGAEIVFHLLSTTSPATAESDPSFDVRTNVVPTISLLETSVDAGVSRFFYASTGGAIYGPQERSAFSETDSTLPVSPYAIGKLSIENYLRYFDAMHGLSSTVLRISNPYGTRQPPHRRQGLIPIALRQIVEGRPVVRYGDGSMVRDYLYVDDLVQMVMPMIRVTPRHSLYNLGSGVGLSVAEVLASIRQVTGVDFAIEEWPVPPTFVDRVVLDTSRYVEEFGSFPLTALEEGILRTYADIRDHRER